MLLLQHKARLDHLERPANGAAAGVLAVADEENAEASELGFGREGFEAAGGEVAHVEVAVPDEDESLARRQGHVELQWLAVLAGSEALGGAAERPGRGVQQVHVELVVVPVRGLPVAQQDAAQEGGDEAVVGVAEAEAEARVGDAAAHVAARRGAAHERGRVGARRDRSYDVDRERRRLVPPPPWLDTCLSLRPWSGRADATARHGRIELWLVRGRQG